MLTVTITAFEKSVTARPDTVRNLEGFVAYLYNKHFPDIIGKRLILDRLEQKSKEEYIAHMYRMSHKSLGLGVIGPSIRDYDPPAKVVIRQCRGGSDIAWE